MRPDKPARTVRRARQLRKAMSRPEALLWGVLKGSPLGQRFRRQHPVGPYVLDFFPARSNLAIEIDGLAHDMGDRPERDAARDAWLAAHRIDTLRIAAAAVLRDAAAVADAILLTIEDRLQRFGKTVPPRSDEGAAA